MNQSTRPSTGPGAGFERFRDIEFLAEGGMGQILAATDPDLNRRVAIKILRPDIAANQMMVAKFRNEIELTGQLEHPGIVPVYETGQTHDGSSYFSFKMVQGESMAELMGEHRKLEVEGGKAFDPTPFLFHLLRVCDTLSFVHSRGIIHRDLKPANIMLGSFGEVLVMDWGLARKIRGTDAAPAEERSEHPPQVPHDPLQTVEGSILGTLAYMAPEQARGEMNEIDEQTDVYALGAILYDIVTGTPPQTDDSRNEVIYRVAHGELERPSVRAPEANIPADLEAVILKAMASEKGDRYPDVRAFQADIQAYLDRAYLDRPVKGWLRPVLWLLTGLILGLVVMRMVG